MPLFGFGKMRPADGEGPATARTGGAYAGLRDMVLGLSPAEAHAQPSAELPRVWAVIIDWGTANGVATFVALADGTSSMYTSTGGGVIGVGEHEPVRVANRALLLAAEAAHDELVPVAAAAPPRLDRVAYWVRTYDGLRAIEHGNGRPTGPPWLQRLADAFQDFVSAIRIADEQRG